MVLMKASSCMKLCLTDIIQLYILNSFIDITCYLILYWTNEQFYIVGLRYTTSYLIGLLSLKLFNALGSRQKNVIQIYLQISRTNYYAIPISQQSSHRTLRFFLKSDNLAFLSTTLYHTIPPPSLQKLIKEFTYESWA